MEVTAGDECPHSKTPVDCPCSTGAATAAQQNVLVQTDQPQKLPQAEQALSPSQEFIIRDAGLDTDDLLVSTPYVCARTAGRHPSQVRSALRLRP